MDVMKWRNWPHVLEMQQFDVEALEKIVKHASAFEDAMRSGKPLPRLSAPKPRRMRTLFYEGSTRTETTFFDAATALGCVVHAVKDPKTFSSALKGESFEDAIAAFTRVGGMGHLRGTDCVIIRHPEEGSSRKAAHIIDTALGDGEAKIPLAVMNAGDGMEQHPTQALTDLATMYRERGTGQHPCENLTILFPGDLRRSRVVNSLLYAFGRHGNQHKIKVLFCCPDGYSPKGELLSYLARHRVNFEFLPVSDFPDAIKQALIVYMTRIQRERQDGPTISAADRSALVFRKEYLQLLQPGAFVMHPLPINNDPEDPPPEIDVELASLAYKGDPRCAWQRQSHRGLPVRAATLDLIFAGMDEIEKTL